MKPRYAAALGMWLSRFIAVMLLALPWAWLAVQANLQILDRFQFDPQSEFLSSYYSPSRYSVPRQFIGWLVIGSAYVATVEALAWCIRKLSHFIFQKTATHPQRR
jgi:hypothetical protein